MCSALPRTRRTCQYSHFPLFVFHLIALSVGLVGLFPKNPDSKSTGSTTHQTSGAAFHPPRLVHHERSSHFHVYQKRTVFFFFHFLVFYFLYCNSLSVNESGHNIFRFMANKLTSVLRKTWLTVDLLMVLKDSCDHVVGVLGKIFKKRETCPLSSQKGVFPDLRKAPVVSEDLEIMLHILHLPA